MAPSTPSRRSYMDPIPSTTPAGPPPSSSKSLFFHNDTPSRNSPGGYRSRVLFGAASSSRQPLFGSSAFGSSQPGSRLQKPRSTMVQDESMLDDEDPDSLARISPGIPALASSLIGDSRNSIRGMKRPRSGTTLTPAKAKADIRAYAKGILSTSNSLKLGETNSFIIRTEMTMESFEQNKQSRPNDLDIQTLATSTSKELLQVWKSEFDPSRDIIESPDFTFGDESPASTVASNLASLLLGLHHPGAWESIQRTSTRRKYQEKSGAKTIPEVLIRWLWANHEPGADIADSVKKHQNTALAEGFFDALLTLTLRAKFEDVRMILERADFREADLGYTNPQLDYIEEALELILQLFEQAPGIESNDWDIRGASWGVFRHRVKKVEDEMRRMFEGDEGMERIDQSQLKLSLSRSSRLSESCLPQDMYDGLNDICEILLGDQTTIFNSCYDWIEASIALTIWWDGEEHEDMKGSTRQRRQRQSRQVDVTPTLAYRQQLSSAFIAMLNEEELPSEIDFNDPLHVGLCCILGDDIEGAIDILQHFSIVVAATVVQIAKLGGWLIESSIESTTLRGLDQSDIMVLNYANGPRPGMKDEVLKNYAKLLASKQQIDYTESVYEGWELSLAVISRIDDETLKSHEATNLLKTISLSTPNQVNKVIEACNLCGFTAQALQVAEQFGDDLVGSQGSYGEALIYYAKSHNIQKMKELLHTLITVSVVKSFSYPPKQEVDSTLAELLISPQNAVEYLDNIDGKAAYILSTYLSGYATVRKFYDLRDDLIQSKSEDSPNEAYERRVICASALMAIITSAADSIRGGLLDSRITVVIPVDNLILLLGEVLIFLNQSRPILSSPQLMLLVKVVEDLETINRQIFANCETTFKAGLADAHNSTNESPQLLQKSLTNLTQSSAFSFVGSSMFRSQILSGTQTTTNSAASSGVLIDGPTKRGWDWRSSLHKESSPEVVIRILRLGLAKDIAKVWVAVS